MNAPRRAVESLLGATLAIACGSGATDTWAGAGQHSFFNEGKLLALGIDVTAARLSGPQEFLPLGVVVLNRHKEPITILREGFTLVRPDGVRLPLVSVDEYWKDHPRRRADAHVIVRFYESVFGRYPTPPFHWTPLDFFPDKHAGAVPRDGLTLRFAEGTFGLLYFRQPLDRGDPPLGGYQLLFRSRGTEETFVVDFLPYSGKHSAKGKTQQPQDGE